MKAVYRSIKPYWLYLILIGIKTIEVGKTFPKADDWNKVVFLHCSKDMKSFKRIPEKDREWMRKYLGKVACRFVCDKIIYAEEGCYANIPRKESQVDAFDLMDYADGKPVYGWHISNLVIYDKPRELWEFHPPCDYKGDCVTCRHFDYFLDCNEGYCIRTTMNLTRPPQSWCYVEEGE